jgi:RNA polymerase sigma-70 factor (ECF subfamily)
MRTDLSDDELLVCEEPEAFGVFYARHHEAIHRYFRRRVPADLAADLTAETFASALIARRRFAPGATPAIGWLYMIASRRLVDHQRRAVVDMRTREALVGAAGPWGAESLDEEACMPALESGLLRHLPAEQRQAVLARIVEDREFARIADAVSASEASVRQRVSRGLSALRGPLIVYRAAQQLAREDRGYRFGGGHGKPVDAIDAAEPLDCSAASSLLLARVGLLTPGNAWTSSRFAGEWGEPGEGRYVTLWASEHHVWLEFKLDADHGERFDPTPARLAPSAGWLRRSPAPGEDVVPRHWPGL